MRKLLKGIAMVVMLAVSIMFSDVYFETPSGAAQTAVHCSQGGTGTSTVPGSNQLLVGTGSSTTCYDYKVISAGANVSVTTTGSSVVISSSASSTISSDPIVIFATGQSNMSWTAQATGFSWDVPDNLYNWNYASDTETTGTAFETWTDNTETGVAIGFAAEVARHNPGAPVYLVNVSYGGQSITKWQSTATAPDHYQTIRNNMTTALSAIGETEIDYLLWWQGENDLNQADGWYYPKLAEVIDGFADETWMSSSTPQVYFELRDEVIPAGTDGHEQINAQIREFVSELPNRIFKQTDYNWRDTNHLTEESWYYAGRDAYWQLKYGVPYEMIYAAYDGDAARPGYAFSTTSAALASGMFYDNGSLGWSINGTKSLDLSYGSGTSTATLGKSAVKGCVQVRDADDGGWSHFYFKNGSMITEQGACN